MVSQVESRIRACEHLGPWLISRGVLIGQICCHPENVDASLRPHLFSKTCEEWGEDCPLKRKQQEAD